VDTVGYCMLPDNKLSS